MSAVLDRLSAINGALARISRDRPARARRVFTELDDNSQRSVIREYMQRNPEQKGLHGEARNEHRLANAIDAAWFANDLETYARLCDRAEREYIGAIVQREWDKQS